MMRSGIKYEQGNIVLAPFPFTDLSTTKQRPILIISNNQYNNKTQDLVTCGITSNPKDTDFSVLINNNDLINGKIPIASRIKVDKLFTLSQDIIKKKLDMVKIEILEKVKKEFLKLL